VKRALPTKPVNGPRLLALLPPDLENAKALLDRRKKAAERKTKWVAIYREAYEYALPQRETFYFTEGSEGEKLGRELYDSTAVAAVDEAANLLQSMLTPSWREWCQYGPGSEVNPQESEDPAILEQLQDATNVLFQHLNHSNLSSVLAECYQDLMVGTCALTCDEGDGERVLEFRSVPLAEIELEEGPWGTVETCWLERKPRGRNIERMFPGIKLTTKTKKGVKENPEAPVTLTYGCVFRPKDGHYYGVVIDQDEVVWRYDYGLTGPYIVARASVRPGELYGRGNVLKALPNIRTLNAMVEFQLRHSALQIAPPFTSVSDGVLNPYTAQFAPATIIPVASNADGNPSLRALDMGGNFAISQDMILQLREDIRKTLMVDTRRREGPVQTATEVAIEDRDLLQQQGAMFGRIQSELLTAIVRRATDILVRRGKIPPLKVDGKLITLKYVSPLARAQDTEDLLALSRALEVCAPLGPEIVNLGFKTEAIPAFVGRKTGLDQSLIRTEEEQAELKKTVAAGAQAIQQRGGAPA